MQADSPKRIRRSNPMRSDGPEDERTEGRSCPDRRRTSRSSSRSDGPPARFVRARPPGSVERREALHCGASGRPTKREPPVRSEYLRPPWRARYQATGANPTYLPARRRRPRPGSRHDRRAVGAQRAASRPRVTRSCHPLPQRLEVPALFSGEIRRAFDPHPPRKARSK